MRQIHKRIHEEGNKAILITLSVVVLLVVGMNLLWPKQTVWHLLGYLFLLTVMVIIVRFFRVPLFRQTTILHNAVLSPADGVVAANEIVMEDEYFHEKRRQISIFMSIYNVHVNFFPLTAWFLIINTILGNICWRSIPSHRPTMSITAS